MAKTVLTSATSYASASDLIKAHSADQIGQWCQDSKLTLTAGMIMADATVAAALLRASGMVEAYALRGGRYTPQDLAALTGAGQAMLIGLVVDLAYYLLARRRLKAKDAEDVAGYDVIKDTLTALGEGSAIFGFQEIVDAGVMSTVDTAKDSRNLKNRPTDIASRYFGRRMDDFTGNPLTGGD